MPSIGISNSDVKFDISTDKTDVNGEYRRLFLYFQLITGDNFYKRGVIKKRERIRKKGKNILGKNLGGKNK
jgi:hypothetical protein